MKATTAIAIIIGFIMGFVGTEVIREKYLTPDTQAPTRTEAQRPTERPTYYEVEMNVSAYCKNACCCGDFADGYTASGAVAEGLICAAPPEYSFGTVMDVDGVQYTVKDRGGAIKGNKLDLLFSTHQEALNFGRKTITVKVYLKGKP